MAIHNITRFEFDRLLPTRSILEGFTGRQVEWCADDQETIIGAVDQARVGDGWSYVVLKKDTDGSFRVAELKAEFTNRDTARAELLRAMNATPGGATAKN